MVNIEMSDAEYQDWLHSQESATQEDKISEHDAWWNSLTNEQKQKLYEEAEAAERDRMDEELWGPNKRYGAI